MKEKSHPRRPPDSMFRLLVENIGDVLWFKRLEPMQFTYLSSAFEVIWKRPVEAAYAEAGVWEASIHPEDRPAVGAALERWFAGESAEYEVEYRVIGGDGEVRWVADRGHIMSRRDGRPLEIAGIARDITERQQGEQERARLAAVVESSEDAIMTLDLNGVIRTWNRGAEGIFGYSAEEVIGRPVAMLRPPEAADDEAVFQERIRQGLRIQHYETVRRRKDGEVIDISLSISPLRDRHGRLTGFSKISRDITQRRQAELMMQRLNAELESRVKERTAALSRANEELEGMIRRRRELEREVLNISEREQRRIGRDLHDDLGQRIAGAWMRASVVQRSLMKRAATEAGGVAEVAELLGEALDCTRALARGLHPVAPQEGGLVMALRELVERGRALFDKDCYFRSRGECGLDDPEVATHLYRIAQEAMSNAVKHGQASRIEVVLERLQGWLQLRIDDDGVGLENTGVPPEGMGLRIMHYRADMIGAQLEILPCQPRGTSVRCRLPFQLSEADKSR
jgi:PAS domain S-box-containing protein